MTGHSTLTGFQNPVRAMENRTMEINEKH